MRLKFPKHLFKSSRSKSANFSSEVYRGNYSSWNEAASVCSGYGDRIIFEKTKKAALAVREGLALFERDSFLFKTEKFCWELMAIMSCIAARNGGKLSVLDFGGSLGSTYFQNKKLLNLIPHVTWCVVEQDHYVSFGKENLEDDILRFCPTIEDAIEMYEPNITLFGSVLQYLPCPSEQLSSVINQGLKSILIDRTAFHMGDSDLLTVQHVNPKIYDASYPAWFFSLERFKKMLENYGYNIMTEWTCEDRYPIKGFETSFRGMFCQSIV